MTSVALFNHRSGVGKTALTYHLAHIVSRLGVPVMVVDLDPQADLTELFLDGDELDELWSTPVEDRDTVAGAVQPIVDGGGDLRPVAPREVAENLWLLPGDLGLSVFEEKLSGFWAPALSGDDPAAFSGTAALHRLIANARAATGAPLALIDVGPSLGPLNRSALLAADHVLVPMKSDLPSVQAMRSLGPALRRWRRDWQETAIPGNPHPENPENPQDASVPAGSMTPIGYIVQEPIIRLNRPPYAYGKWLRQIPGAYATAVLGLPPGNPAPDAEIAVLHNYRNLMQLTLEARKPMFDLRAADGAMGSTQRYVQQCLQTFRAVGRNILGRLPLEARDAVDR